MGAYSLAGAWGRVGWQCCVTTACVGGAGMRGGGGRWRVRGVAAQEAARAAKVAAAKASAIREAQAEEQRQWVRGGGCACSLSRTQDAHRTTGTYM